MWLEIKKMQEEEKTSIEYWDINLSKLVIRPTYKYFHNDMLSFAIKKMD